MAHGCACFFIPKSVLERFANDKKLPPAVRRAALDSAIISDSLRDLRAQHSLLVRATRVIGAHLEKGSDAPPEVVVFDAEHKTTLPGRLVRNAESGSDVAAKRSGQQALKVAMFLKEIFGRNSIDDAGGSLLSSVHYGLRYNNAMWNGSEMVYGDGDGEIFIDFTGASDVIAHELTHAVTEHTLQLGYANDAGGLNESLSDCFGSMFRQWEGKQTVQSADWLIGSEILGPAAKAQGATCLRNMANPADPKALSIQPTHYSQITAGMDPHLASGPPNLAFYKACTAVGGESWSTVGRVWYQVMISSGSQPNMTMKEFANRARQAAAELFATKPEVQKSIDGAWKDVGL